MKYRNIHNQNYQNLFGMVGNLERFGSVDAMVALPFSTRNVLSLPTATDRWVSNKLKDWCCKLSSDPNLHISPTRPNWIA